MQLPFPHPVRTVWKLLALLRRDNPDITNGECAKQLGYNANSIGAWLRSPLYQSYDSQSLAVKVSRADVKEELDEFAVEMLGRLRDIVEHSSDEKLIASIGFDALDRAGYAEPKRDAQRPIQLILTSEVLSALMQRSREIADTTDVVVGEVLQSESVA
jgi:hypothetical protein